jgi:hypothetical protein
VWNYTGVVEGQADSAIQRRNKLAVSPLARANIRDGHPKRLAGNHELAFEFFAVTATTSSCAWQSNY